MVVVAVVAVVIAAVAVVEGNGVGVVVVYSKGWCLDECIWLQRLINGIIMYG